MKLIKKFFMWIFTIPCPNCESAWLGGHPAPETIDFCIVCTNPRTGKYRCWTWRWAWIGRRNVAKNLKQFRKKQNVK